MKNLSEIIKVCSDILSWLQLGKKIKENDVLQKQNKALRRQLYWAACPCLSWGNLLGWLRGAAGQGSMSAISGSKS